MKEREETRKEADRKRQTQSKRYNDRETGRVRSQRDTDTKMERDGTDAQKTRTREVERASDPETELTGAGG